jgi:hypothetical protein
MATKTDKAQKVKTLQSLVTPDGIAAYAWLNKPDDRFKPKFTIDVHFDKTDPKVKKFFKLLVELNAKWLRDNGKKFKKAPMPKCIKVVDEERSAKLGIPVGTPYIQFSTSAENNEDPIAVFDANGARTNQRVYGGDVVAIDTSIGGWITPQGVGIKGYLNSVQLLKSNWTGGRDSSGSKFGVRDDYISEDGDDAEIDEPDASGLEEEDLDFGKDDPTEGIV